MKQRRGLLGATASFIAGTLLGRQSLRAAHHAPGAHCYASPKEAMRSPRETTMFVTALRVGINDKLPDYLATVDVDLLLTDLSMPEMNGLALIDSVRRQWPRLKVALMTGADFTYIDGVHDASGADIILQKPFEIDELCYLVETVMSAAPRTAL